MSVQDQIAMDNFLIQNNVITQKDLMLKYNKHLTEQQAESMINENRETNGQGTETEQEQSVFNRLLNQAPPAE